MIFNRARNGRRTSSQVACAVVCGAALTTGLLGATGPAQAAQGGAQSGGSGELTRLTWDLAADFQLSPNQANPAPDRYGNPGVWSYRTGLRGDPATYLLMSTFTDARHEIDGLETWSGTSLPPDFVPHVGINASGADADYLGIHWPAGRILVHPHDGLHAAVIAWTSPITDNVNVRGRAKLAQLPGCGNGISWSIWRGYDPLLGGVVPPGEPAERWQTRVAVEEGETIYLIIDARSGNFTCDSTDLGLKITARTDGP